MTFEKLHKDMPDGCECLQYGSKPVKDHTFCRYGHNLPSTAEDFESYHEQKKPFTKKSCKDRCHHRGVSIYLFDKTPERRKAELKSAYQFSPLQWKFAYFVRVRDDAGLIMYPKRSDHCELLKCDKFSLRNHVEFIDEFDMSDPN